MNSIKNAIVTVTLLVVGYGAYVVLSNPSPQGNEQIAASGGEGDTAAELEMPDVDVRPVGEQDSVATPPTDTRAAAPQDSASYRNEYQQPTVPIPMPDPSTSGVPSTDTRGGLGDARTAPATVPGSPSGYPSTSYPQSEFDSGADPYSGGGSAYDSSPTDPGTTQPMQDAGASEPAVGQVDPTAAPLQGHSAQPFPAEDSASGGGPIATSPGSVPFETVWQASQQHLQAGELVEALANLSDWYGDPTLSREQTQRCVDLLDQLAGSVIYSRDHHLEPAYQVQPGETLADIAQRYQVPEEFLARVNGIAPPHAVVTGDTLKVMRGPFRGEVGLQQREFTLFLGRFYAGRFAIQLGRDLPSQEAFYEVAEKSDGRSYFDRRLGREILKGETDNRYGKRWLGLRGDQITVGHAVGIHSRPDQVQPDAEVGSISLAPPDADDVHAILSVGSRIHVRR